MKQKNQWIDTISDARLRELAKEHKKDLIAPGESVRVAVLDEIARAGGRGGSRVLPFAFPVWVGYGAAALLAILIGTGFFAFFRTVGASQVYVSLASGITAYSTGKTSAPVIAGMHLGTGYLLSTAAGSFLEIRDERQGIFMLEEESSLRLASIDTAGMSLFLERGTFAAGSFDRTLKKLYSVKTANATILFRGAIFIRFRNGKTVVASQGDGAEVGSSAGEKLLEPAQSIVVNEDGSFGATQDSAFDSGTLFRALGNLKAMKKRAGMGVLTITADMKDVTLFVDGDEVCRFNRSMSILLPPGDHEISLEKDGYESFRKEMSLGKGDNPALDVAFEGKFLAEKSWRARPVYTYRNRENPGESAILGFAVSRDFVAAVTRNSYLLFSANGTLIRENVYGKSRRIFFDSVPLILDNRLYISANDRLLDIDLLSGDERVIDTPGMISDGFRLYFFKNLLFLSLPGGIYGFDPDTGRLDRSARYPANSPASPLVAENGLYVSSVVSRDILYYSLDGRTRRLYAMKEPAFCEPILSAGDVVAGDGSGTIYKLTRGLEAVSSLSLDSGVAALVPVTEGRFVAMSEKGIMYLIDGAKLAIIKEIKIDNAPDSMIYSYKKPVLAGANIFIGTNDGSMLIVDATSGSTRASLHLKRGAVSCSVYRVGDVLVTGTENGDVFFIE